MKKVNFSDSIKKIEEIKIMLDAGIISKASYDKMIKVTKSKAKPDDKITDAKIMLDAGIISKASYDKMIEISKSKDVKRNLQGIISSLNPEKSYGFINFGGKKPAYFKTSDCYHGAKPRDCVRFNLVPLPDTKYIAKNVVKDLERQQLRDACDVLYDVSDGSVDVDPDTVSPGDVSRLLSMVHAEKKEHDRRRRHRIREVMKALKTASSAQILFMMDSTGSMGGHIAAAKNQIGKLRDSIVRACPGASLTFGFVAYKDPLERDPPPQVLDFTADPDKFSYFLEGVSAGGGGDEAEDVCRGLEAAGSLSWQPQVGSSILYHIADAPCHGKLFHGGSASDHHPDFDPDGSRTQRALQQLTEKGMSEYVFLKINGTTDRMIVKYARFLGRKIDTVDINSADAMMTTIATRSITSISAKSRAVSHKALEDERGGKKKIASILKEKMGSILDTPFAKAHLSPIKEESQTSRSSTASSSSKVREDGAILVDVHTCKMPGDAGSITRPLRLERTPKKRYFKIDEKELGRGGVRIARIATDCTFDKKVHCVFKTHIDENKLDFDDLRRVVVNDVQTQSMGAFLAREFSKLPEVKKKVNYLKASLIEFNKDGRSCVGQVERMLDLDGEIDFIKWNSNADFSKSTDDPQYSITLNAFSHWTYEYTKHYLMVVDVQGIPHGTDAFILTDPAIHCKDASRFGVTNFSEEGMKEFLNAHKCNSLCMNLGLPVANPSKSIFVSDTMIA